MGRPAPKHRQPRKKGGSNETDVGPCEQVGWRLSSVLNIPSSSIPSACAGRLQPITAARVLPSRPPATGGQCSAIPAKGGTGTPAARARPGRRCSAQSSQASKSCKRGPREKSTWLTTRSKSESRCEEMSTVRRPALAHGEQHAHEIAAADGVEAGDGSSRMTRSGRVRGRARRRAFAGRRARAGR